MTTADHSDKLRAADWMVCDADIVKAAALIRKYHYAGGSANTGVAIHGLYRRSDYKLMGAAWWMPPIQTKVTDWYPNPKAVLTLSRLVLDPLVPKNGATFLLMKSVKMVPPEWECLITFADTWRGHTGHIYRAAGWEYLGLSKPQNVYVKDEKLVCKKAGPKTRTHAEMLALGAECIGSFSKHRFRLIRKARRRDKDSRPAQSLLIEA